MRILVTGGAGYIGSHTAKALACAGFEPVVLDNFSRGHRWTARWGRLVEMDLADRQGLGSLLRELQPAAVVHFAAFAYVEESVRTPSEYFRNNLVNSLNLLDAMRENGIPRIVFSSTCSTYGEPQQTPISESHPQRPMNPYGESKLMVERALAWYGEAYGLSWAALRYFNAAGADPEGELGEAHHPETHLIPRTIAAAYGDIPELHVFGTDYPTPDGTAVRDYIHVTDLATAHIQAVKMLADGGRSRAINLGTGVGHSVKEVIAAVEKASGRSVPARYCPRRPGDPASLVADASSANAVLGWTPRYSTLDQIVQTASRWYERLRSGEIAE